MVEKLPVRSGNDATVLKLLREPVADLGGAFGRGQIVQADRSDERPRYLINTAGVSPVPVAIRSSTQRHSSSDDRIASAEGSHRDRNSRFASICANRGDA